MSAFLGVAAIIALLIWLMGGKRRRTTRAPEDAVETMVDHKELEAAERELADDQEARPIHDGMVDDDDDWGPGTPR